MKRLRDKHRKPPLDERGFDGRAPLSVPSDLERSETSQLKLNYHRSLVKDRGFEKRLPLKGLFVVILVLGALAIRVFLG